jgi:hypothetical protein
MGVEGGSGREDSPNASQVDSLGSGMQGWVGVRLKSRSKRTVVSWISRVVVGSTELVGSEEQDKHLDIV